jgi:hypothetical protein
MSHAALMKAVKNRLQAVLGLDDTGCDIGLDGQPPPIMGEQFIVVWPGHWGVVDCEGLGEEYSVNVTTTRRLGAYPQDRQGTEVLVKAATGLEPLLRQIIMAIHLDVGADAILNAANVLIGSNVNGFVEPLRFQDGGRPELKGAEWFESYGGEQPEDRVGVAQTLSFGSAKRFQSIENLADRETVGFTVSSSPSSVTSGGTVSVTITAVDYDGHTVNGYTGTVHFTCTDGTATLPANSTLTLGPGVFSATLNRNCTLTATDITTTTITGSASIVAVGAATHFTVSGPASLTVGVAFNVTVTAKDQDNNTATGYAGSLLFAMTPDVGCITFPSGRTLTSGVGTFSQTMTPIGTGARHRKRNHFWAKQLDNRSPVTLRSF